MRLFLLTSLLLVAFSARAQTYFYINTIQVQPGQPSDQDQVSLALMGDLSSSGAYIVSSSATVSGSTVTLDVVAADPGGLAVLVPHTETVLVGQLPAGTYAVQVNGTFVADLAPPGQHSFMVTGAMGSPCDSVDVLDVSYHPFDPDRLLLTSFNGSMALFPYPGFILLDANDDTLGIEPVDYFGLAGTTVHDLNVHPQAVLPQGPFSGTAELWVGFGDSLACSFGLSDELCPDTTCTPLTLSLGNFGGMLVSAVFDWQLLDAQQVAVASGTLELDNMTQDDTAVVCLPPGSYNWTMSTAGFPGGQLYMGIMEGGQGPDTSMTFQQGVVNTMPFSVYEDCPGTINGQVDRAVPRMLQVIPHDGMLEVFTGDGSPVGNFYILDLSGRWLAQGRFARPSGSIDVSHLPSGAYVLRTGRSAVRFLLARP